MADKDLRARLKRLFSTGTVVRVIGKNRLKIVDTDEMQMFGRSNLRSRYAAIHRAGTYGSNFRETNLAYQAVRRELFRDYEAMDNDPIIASALDIYADESTVKDEFGDILTIISPNDDIKLKLENLFYDILNIEFNLWPWVRSICKYGDLFLHLNIKEGIGIVNVEPLSVYEVTREEAWDKEHIDDVRFLYEAPAIGKLTFENFEIAHFRLLSDSNFIPYGKGIIENARRIWKQLSLMEDAMMIHRIMRAPERRIFKIDVGNIEPSAVDAVMERMKNEIKKVPYVDPQTGEYNLRYNIQNLTEDFFLPVRGGDSGTNIENLPGLEYQTIEDIDYLKNKMFAALKIPKAFMGYEEDTSGKALLAAEDMRFARTIERVQRMVVSELAKIAMIHLYSQGHTDEDLVNFTLTLTNPSTIYEQEKIRIWQEKISLARDIRDVRMMSEDWIYKNIFNIPDEEVDDERDRVIDDIKRKFRHEQIEQEGNDPAKSGQMVQQGQVVDPFSETADDFQQNGQQPPGFANEDSTDFDDDVFKKGGRPKDNQTKYRTDRHFAGRDPIGSRSIEKSMSVSEASKILKSLKTSMKSDRKLVSETNSMLDENNIIE